MATADTYLSAEQAAAAVELLHRAPYAHLAVTEPGGPYVMPLNFVYLPAEAGTGSGAGSAAGTAAGTAAGGAAPTRLAGSIFFHTGEGRKTTALAADPRVCLAVTGDVEFVQGESPCRDAFTYRSVLTWGRARRVDDATARETALRAIVAKYDPSAAGMPFSEADFARTLLYEVSIEAASYKQEP